MRAGDLRYRALHQTQSESVNAYGERILTWSTRSSMRVGIANVSAAEAERGGRRVQESTHKITFRYDSAVVPGTRFLFNSREFDVLSIVEAFDRRQRWATAYARETS